MPKRYGAREFQSDPMQFMNNNILIPIHASIGMSQESARIRQLTMVTGDPVSTTAKKGGSDIEVFYLRPWTNEDPFDQSIFAYWCPYAQEQTLSCMLGNGALYMFTAVMDGCSFGVGSQKDGSCLVGHSNTGTSTRQVSETGNLSISQARYQQRITQRNKLWSALGGYSAKVISPKDYMIDADGEVVLKATTFGLHELGKNWNIFTQRWIKPTPRSIVLRDVTQQHAG